MRSLLITLLMIGSVSTYAQNICAPANTVDENQDDLTMNESQFNFDNALRSIDWLENDIWSVLKSKKTIDELFNSTEQFGIPLPNSVSIIKGTLYKQQALLKLEQVKLLELKVKNGQATAEELDYTKKQAEKATTKFCELLSESYYVD